MMKNSRTLAYALVIPCLVALCYIGMRSFVHIGLLPQQSNATYFWATLAIIAVGLALPYFILKSAFKSAEASDPNQKPLRLQDIAKDQAQVRK